MTTFTTTINSMYTLNTPDPGYVVNVLWTVTGVDGDNTASIGGNTQFSSADQEGAFVPYESLTEAQVLAWIPANRERTSLRAGPERQHDHPTCQPTKHNFALGSLIS
jgi:hypothetical protein